MPNYTIPQEVGRCIHCDATLYFCDEMVYPKWDGGDFNCIHETDDTDEPIDDIDALCTWKW